VYLVLFHGDESVRGLTRDFAGEIRESIFGGVEWGAAAETQASEARDGHPGGFVGGPTASNLWPVLSEPLLSALRYLFALFGTQTFFEN